MPRRETPQERTRRAVYATGNRWAIENLKRPTTKPKRPEGRHRELPHPV